MSCNDLIVNANNPFVKKDGTIPFTANQSLGGNKFTDVADGAKPNDLVNYGQLLSALNGITSIGNEYMAGENIPAFTIVHIKSDGKLYKANNTDISQMNKVIGITTKAALYCDMVKVAQMGTLKGLNDMTPGRYYFFNSNGRLDYNAPTTGFSQIVGFATSPTVFLVGIQIPIGL